MIAAGIRAALVDGAQTAFAIQVVAIVVAHARQGENPGLLAEALDQAVFLQALGDVLRRVAHLELIDDADADQVFDLDLDRQRASAGNTGAAHGRGVFGPGIDTVDFRGGDQVGLHQACIPACIRARDDTGVGECVNNHLPVFRSGPCFKALTGVRASFWGDIHFVSFICKNSPKTPNQSAFLMSNGLG